MKLFLIKIFTFFSLVSFGQLEIYNKYCVGTSLGYVGRGHKKSIQDKDLINLSNSRNICFNISFNYTHKNKFGVIVLANLAEYGLDSLSYTPFISKYYANYSPIKFDGIPHKIYNLKGGLTYTFRIKKFEILPSLLLGRYFYISPLNANLVIKENGSNLTREFDYKPISMKNLFNSSAILFGKYNFESGFGLHFIIEYCYSKSSINYLVKETEYLNLVSEYNFNKRINLSSVSYVIGFHRNISSKEKVTISQ